MNQTLINILQTVGMSSLIGIILAFIFNRRLAKLKSKLTLNEKLMGSVADGAVDYIAKFRVALHGLHKAFEALRIDSSVEVEKNIQEFQEALQDFRTTIHAQRIYLVWFFPVGCSLSESGEAIFHAAEMCLLTLKFRKVNQEFVDDMLKIINEAEGVYSEMSSQIVEFLRQIQSGEIVPPKLVTSHDYPATIEESEEWLEEHNLLETRIPPYSLS